MKLEIRAHDFGKLDVEELTEKIADKGFASIQLALSKAISGIDTGYGKLSPGVANYIGETFRKKNLQIAVLGCYINPIHPDLKLRKESIERFKEHLRFARDFESSIVATETGSFNPDCTFHSENNFTVFCTKFTFFYFNLPVNKIINMVVSKVFIKLLT